MPGDPPDHVPRRAPDRPGRGDGWGQPAARTVAFPAISTGVFGYPVEEAAGVAIVAIRGAETSVEEVRFVLFGREAFEAFEVAVG